MEANRCEGDSYKDHFGKSLEDLKRNGSLKEWRLYVLSRELSKYENEKAEQRKDNTEINSVSGESDTKLAVTKAKSRTWSIEERINELIQCNAGSADEVNREPNYQVNQYTKHDVIENIPMATELQTSETGCCSACQCQLFVSMLNEVWDVVESFRKDIQALRDVLSIDLDDVSIGGSKVQENPCGADDRPYNIEDGYNSRSCCSELKGGTHQDANGELTKKLLELMHHQFHVLEDVFQLKSATDADLLRKVADPPREAAYFPKEAAALAGRSKKDGTLLMNQCFAEQKIVMPTHHAYVEQEKENGHECLNDIVNLKERVNCLEVAYGKLECPEKETQPIGSNGLQCNIEQINLAKVFALVRIIFENFLLELKAGKRSEAKFDFLENCRIMLAMDNEGREYNLEEEMSKIKDAVDAISKIGGRDMAEESQTNGVSHSDELHKGTDTGQGEWETLSGCSKELLAQFVADTAVRRAINELNILNLQDRSDALQQSGTSETKFNAHDVDHKKVPIGTCLEGAESEAANAGKPLKSEEASCECFRRKEEGESRKGKTGGLDPRAVAEYVVAESIAKAVTEAKYSENEQKLETAFQSKICSLVRSLEQSEDELKKHKRTIESDVKRIDCIMNELNQTKTKNEELKRAAKSDKGQIKQKTMEMERMKKKIIDLKSQCQEKRVSLQSSEDLINQLKLEVQNAQQKASLQGGMVSMIKSRLFKATREICLLRKNLEKKEKAVEAWELAVASFICKLSIEKAMSLANNGDRWNEMETKEQQLHEEIATLKNGLQRSQATIDALNGELDALRVQEVEHEARGVRADFGRIGLHIRSLKASLGLQNKGEMRDCNAEGVIFDLTELEQEIIRDKKRHVDEVGQLRSLLGEWVAHSVIKQSLQEVHSERTVSKDTGVENNMIAVHGGRGQERKIVSERIVSEALSQAGKVSSKEGLEFGEICKDKNGVLATGGGFSEPNKNEPVMEDELMQKLAGEEADDQTADGDVKSIQNSLHHDLTQIVRTIHGTMAQCNEGMEQCAKSEEELRLWTAKFLIQCGKDMLETKALESNLFSASNQAEVGENCFGVQEDDVSKVNSGLCRVECERGMASQTSRATSKEAVVKSEEGFLKMVATHTCRASIARALIELGVDTADLLSPTPRCQYNISLQSKASWSESCLVVTAEDHTENKSTCAQDISKCDPLLMHELETITSLFLKNETAKLVRNGPRSDAFCLETASGVYNRQAPSMPSTAKLERLFEKGVGEIREPSAANVQAHLMCHSDSDDSIKSGVASEGHLPSSRAGSE